MSVPVVEPQPVGKTVGNSMKGINSALLLIFGAVGVAIADGNIVNWEWLAILVALLRGVLLFGVRPEWGKVGEYLPVALTVLVGVVSQLIVTLQDGGGFSAVEIVGAVVTVLTASFSAYATSNAAVSDKLKLGNSLS
jgi:multisubunit Na+/H+ antiporter MnhG subunit